MSEKSIIFSTPMVQAILEGRKTQTRRVVKPQPSSIRQSPFSKSGIEDGHGRELKPKYQVGNILLVKEAGDRKRPSILPKLASCVWLKITDIKIERLQDISEQDAINEGIEKDSMTEGYQVYPAKGMWTTDPVLSFQTLWDSINDKSKAWEANPWVWVYDFKRIEEF